jgi:TPP-dependent trihydroxycyclohexane-1,2-dione (THcHDO) dehydratase
LQETPDPALRTSERVGFQPALSRPQQNSANLEVEVLGRFCGGQPCWPFRVEATLGDRFSGRHPQSTTKQAFPVCEPRTHITSGSFSSMGFALPAAIGAKLAKPDTPVVCIIGDGDFMMCVQELAVCVMYNIPVVFLVLNNSGYISIRDGQNYLMGRQIGSEFNRHSGDGKPYSDDFVALAKSFGFGTASDAVKADYKAGYAAEQHSCSTTDVELTEPVSATG